MSAAPFLMGFILGPLFEDNLRRSYLISEDISIFFRSPICWIFILLTALSLFVGIRREIATMKKRQELSREAEARP
jgi:putative tricarboxylic transport membrane protein